MSSYFQERLLPYSLEQIYQIITDIDRYAEFLPWCIGSRVLSRHGHSMQAELVIKFKIFTEQYTSVVELTPPADNYAAIDVQQSEGPFHHLHNNWKLTAIDENNTNVVFHIDFAFSNPLLNHLIGGLFEDAIRKMADAFETRAKKLFS